MSLEMLKTLASGFWLSIPAVLIISSMFWIQPPNFKLALFQYLVPLLLGFPFGTIAVVFLICALCVINFILFTVLKFPFPPIDEGGIAFIYFLLCVISSHLNAIFITNIIKKRKLKSVAGKQR